MARRDPSWVVARFSFCLGPLIAILATIVYVISAPAWIVGGDSGEIVTVFARGGVAHPPGYPLYVMILRMFAWVPGNAPHVAGTVTAVMGGFAVAALHRACRAWGASVGAATIASAVFASSAVMWRLSSAPEVFVLNVVIACCIAAAAAPNAPTAARAALAPSGWKRAAQLGFYAGLGLANHHSIVLLAPLGLWAFARSVREDDRKWRPFCAALGALAIGLMPYAYLYVCARNADTNVAWVWGDIHDAASLVGHFRRAEFGSTRLALRDAPLEPLLQLKEMGWALVRDLLGLPVLVAVAAIASLKRVRAEMVALACALLLAGPGFVAIFNIAPRGVGAAIVERFYLMPAALVCLCAAIALDRFLPRLDQRLSASIAVSLMVLIAGFALGATRVAEDHRPTVANYIHNTLAIAPRHAIIVGSGDQKFSGFAFARFVERQRLDVAFITPEMLHASWYRERQSRELGVTLGAPPPDRVALVSTLLSTGRPVAFAGPVPKGVLEAGFVTFPLGTLQVIEPAHAVIPSARSLEATNIEMLSTFELEPVASPTSASWAGATFGEYARTWLVLEAMLRASGDAEHAQSCHDRAQAFAPWLGKGSW